MNRKPEWEDVASIRPDPDGARGREQRLPLEAGGAETHGDILWSDPEPGGCRISRLTTADLDAVMRIETAAYAVPWTRGNFVDSLASGNLAACLLDAHGVMLGYCIAMAGAGELHLLNLTVAHRVQGRGHARHLLDALVLTGRRAGVSELWLEVRASNLRARNLYRRYGLVETGIRKAYYPVKSESTSATREDAVVMNLRLGGVS